MKRLKNTAIYYIVVGIIFLLSFIFFQLWRFSILGIAMLVLYYVLKYGFKIKQISLKFSKKQLGWLDFILVIFPVLFLIAVTTYVWRPYRQKIILPKNFEGVVAIQYNQPNGQEKKWIGGFLGIGASRLINVDSTGVVKTPFKYHKNNLPLLGLKQTKQNRGGLHVFFQDNLKKEIPMRTYYSFEVYKESEFIGFFSGYREPPLIIFVVTEPLNYFKYFMTEEEMIENHKNKYNEIPRSNMYVGIRKLKQKYHYLLKSHPKK